MYTLFSNFELDFSSVRRVIHVIGGQNRECLLNHMGFPFLHTITALYLTLASYRPGTDVSGTVRMEEQFQSDKITLLFWPHKRSNWVGAEYGAYERRSATVKTNEK